jgi:hypothetical protein
MRFHIHACVSECSLCFQGPKWTRRQSAGIRRPISYRLSTGDLCAPHSPNQQLYGTDHGSLGDSPSMVSCDKSPENLVHALCTSSFVECFHRRNCAARHPSSLQSIELAACCLVWTNQLQRLFVARVVLLKCQPSPRLLAHYPDACVCVLVILSSGAAYASTTRQTRTTKVRAFRRVCRSQSQLISAAVMTLMFLMEPQCSPRPSHLRAMAHKFTVNAVKVVLAKGVKAMLRILAHTFIMQSHTGFTIFPTRPILPVITWP